MSLASGQTSPKLDLIVNVQGLQPEAFEPRTSHLVVMALDHVDRRGEAAGEDAVTLPQDRILLGQGPGQPGHGLSRGTHGLGAGSGGHVVAGGEGDFDLGRVALDLAKPAVGHGLGR